MSTTVDVDIDDVVDCLDDEEASELARKLLGDRDTAPLGFGVGDTTTERLVEQAYLAARRVPNLPQEISDLFWHVHGRALA